jgi:CubicO group peptidase (beta-lactamase class C family)
VRAARFAAAVLAAAVAVGPRTDAQVLSFELFERYLDALRRQAGIPGLSAAIVQNRRIVWERGFGWQEVEAALPATPITPYPVADLTETLAAVLLLQCAERGTLDLDAPVARWTDALADPGVTLRHLLAHRSDREPTRFAFDPARYAVLTPVIEACTGRPYRQALAHELLDRLAMVDSVPGTDLADPTSPARALFDDRRLAQYAAVLDRVAAPYRIDARGKPVRTTVAPTGIDAATGLVSTVRDLARLDAALDDRVLLEADSLATMWTNVRTEDGAILPTGLGWFVQSYNGVRVVWHFGLRRDAWSALLVKIPERDLTLILLANSDRLNATFDLAQGDVTRSLFARLFLRLFVG